MPLSEAVPALLHLWEIYLEKLGAEYATTVIVTVALADTCPLESVTDAVKVIVPDVFKNPVVNDDAVLE